MNSPRVLLLIGLFGACGAIARYTLTRLAHNRFETEFPIGTLAVNLAGCFLLGFIVFCASEDTLPELRLALGAGLMGGLTTYSTFSLDTLKALEAGNWQVALGNVALNLVLGLVAVWAGANVGRLFHA